MKLHHLIAELDALRARYGGHWDVVIEHNGEAVNVIGWALLPAVKVVELRHDQSEPLPARCIHHVERD